MKALKVWRTDVYDFIPKNAKGATKIAAMYDSIRKTESDNSAILIFCDTDKPPHDAFNSIKKGIQDIYGTHRVFEKITMYANPCTMLIVLSHLIDHLKLKDQSKSKNASIIQKLTGVKNYKATKKQIDSICKKITSNNYNVMKESIKSSTNEDFSVSGSTNFYTWLERFESSDTSWIDELNKSL